MTIDWQAIGIRLWSGIAVGVVVCGIVWVVVSARGGRTPLPSGVEQRVEHHAEATAIDTMEIHRLERVADSAEVKEQAAIARARANKAQATSKERDMHRDLLVAVPVAAAVANVGVPPDVSIDELRAVTIASAQKDTALAWAKIEVASIDTALARSEARAGRADTLLGDVVKVAESREEPCRILWFVPGPSRWVVMAATAVAVLGVTVRR